MKATTRPRVAKPTLTIDVPIPLLKSLERYASPNASVFAEFGRAVWKAYQKSKNNIHACMREGCPRTFVLKSATSGQIYCSESCGDVERARLRRRNTSISKYLAKAAIDDLGGWSDG